MKTQPEGGRHQVLQTGSWGLDRVSCLLASLFSQGPTCQQTPVGSQRDPTLPHTQGLPRLLDYPGCLFFCLLISPTIVTTLSEVFPGFLICAPCHLQAPPLFTDRTRCEPSRPCCSCTASIPQITVSPTRFLKGRSGRRGWAGGGSTGTSYSGTPRS